MRALGMGEPFSSETKPLANCCATRFDEVAKRIIKKINLIDSKDK
jgi:hypothetical protein